MYVRVLPSTAIFAIGTQMASTIRLSGLTICEESNVSLAKKTKGIKNFGPGEISHLANNGDMLMYVYTLVQNYYLL